MAVLKFSELLIDTLACLAFSQQLLLSLANLAFGMIKFRLERVAGILQLGHGVLICMIHL
jgi:hypothetical protein